MSAQRLDACVSPGPLLHHDSTFLSMRSPVAGAHGLIEFSTSGTVDGSIFDRSIRRAEEFKVPRCLAKLHQHSPQVQGQGQV